MKNELISKTITHIYPKSFGFGGIEKYIEGHKKFFSQNHKEVVWTKYPDKCVDNVNIFHSFLPVVIFRLITFLLIYKRRVILVAHHHPPKHSKKKIQLKLYLVFLGYIFRVFRLTDLILFVVHTHKESESLKALLGNITPHIIPIGLDSDTNFHKINRISKNDTVFDFITIARNDEIKRLPLLFDMARKFPAAKFLLISNIEAKPTPPSNLSIYENVDEDAKYHLLSQSYFYFSTSAYESLGIAIAEAESFGVPALVDLNTGYLSAVRHNDKAYLTYTLETLDERITHLLSFKENKYLQLSQNAKNRAREVSWLSQAKKFGNLHEQCYSNNHNI